MGEVLLLSPAPAAVVPAVPANTIFLNFSLLLDLILPLSFIFDILSKFSLLLTFLCSPLLLLLIL